MPIRPASLRFGQNAPPTGAAFALVRQLLSERPRHFQELLHDGIKALGGETKRTSADVPAPGEAAAKSSKKGKSKGKAVVQDFTNPVPEGHPFVSGAFLKQRILPVLRSQELIKRKWSAPVEGTRLAAERNGAQTIMWELDESGWRSEKWDNLARSDLSEADLSAQGWAVKQIQAAEKAAAREAEFAAGTAERTQRETIAWPGRPRGISMPLERTHLNTRRARNRTHKEERTVQDAALRREAEEVARKVLAGEN